MITKREIREIAQTMVEILNAQNQQFPFTAEEKAKQLGISVSRLYKVKDNYRYIKHENRRRLMFA